MTADYFLRQSQSIQDWSDAINKTAGPALEFVEAVQQERSASMLALAGDPSAAATLGPQRARLDAALPPMMAAGDDLIKLFQGEVGDAVAQMQATFGQLPVIRQRIELGAAPIDEVYEYYNRVIQTVILAGRLAARTATVPEAANEQDTEVGLFATAEAMSRSSILAASATFKGGFTPAQQEEYSKLVGFYRIELDNRVTQLTPEETAGYTALVSSAAWRQMAALEKTLLQRTAIMATPPAAAPDAGSTPAPATATAPLPAGTPPPATTSGMSAPHATSPVTSPSSSTEVGGAPSAASGAPVAASSAIAPLAEWKDASDQVSSQLRGIWSSHLRYAGVVAEKEGSRLSRKSVQNGLAALTLSVLAFIAAILLSQRLIQRLRRLRAETLAISESRLPMLMNRLRRTETIDLDKELPRLNFGRDEIGQVAAAFDHAQKAATTAAVNEAQTRQGVQAVFVNIARRSQTTMHQLLGMLEQAEHRHDDPDTLKMLFEFDNLATRARRNAENLVILGGEQPGRQWRNPVPLHDLVRSAVTETEHYSRVQMVRLPNVPVVGSVVADLIHLIAELIDNAATFSPPQTRVEISGELGGAGLIIEISDLGIGLGRTEIARINETLADPPDFSISTLSSDSRLGLFVVGQLAKRHQVAVRLTESDYGGIRSVVRLPYELVVVDQDELPTPAGAIAIDREKPRSGAHRLDREPERPELSSPRRPARVSLAKQPAPRAEEPTPIDDPDSFRQRPMTAAWGESASSGEYVPDDVDAPRLPQRKRQTAAAAPPIAPMPDSHPSVRIQRDRVSGQGRPSDLWTALQAGTKLGRSGVPVGSPGESMSDNERQWND
ncbi:sensor histidine kinase [Nocardia yamanashiensis]|uniref:sensor histidine kinase n=1 Tax=Nocardia yamanashiensis TaxID=209247 RepID=UPI00082D5EA7|nr:nitrate- and nitrite sensing domain-containing protein [Nocardia yamanashiensis]